MNARLSIRTLACWAVWLTLSACGGGGGSRDATVDPPAAGGTASIGGSGSETGFFGTGGAANGSSGTTGGSTSGATGSASGGTGSASGSGSAGSTGSSGGSGTTTGGAVVPSSGTLQTSTLPPTYPAGSAGSSAWAALNAARQGAGAGLVNQSTRLDVAAAAHATYLISNVGATGHAEDPTKLDFYELSPSSRVAKAGFAAAFLTEAIGNGGTLLGSDCVPELLNSIYHAVSLLSPATHVGFGFGPNFATTPICVSDLATASGDIYGQVAPAGAFVTYPYDGQAGVAESLDVEAQSPRPSPALLPNASAGTPVIVNVRNADYVNFATAGTLSAAITRFTLKDAGGNLVPVVIFVHPLLQSGFGLNADPNLPPGSAVLVPLAPLPRGQTFGVDFAATLKTGAPGLAKTWRFTTRP